MKKNLAGYDTRRENISTRLEASVIPPKPKGGCVKREIAEGMTCLAILPIFVTARACIS